MAPPCARSQPRTFSVSTALATTFVGFAAAAFVAAAGAGTASVVEAARWSQFWMPAPPSCLAKLSASTPFSAMRCNASALICSSLQPGATATPCDRSHLATVSEHSFPSAAAASGAFVMAVGKLCSQALSTSAWVPVFCATEATDRSASTMYCFVRAFTSSSLHVPSKSCMAHKQAEFGSSARGDAQVATVERLHGMMPIARAGRCAPHLRDGVLRTSTVGLV
eukprot:scaffold6844_cov357-Prasinococcus_capsulatus_cf.AAC.7